jgi:hypothetical protein
MLENLGMVRRSVRSSGEPKPFQAASTGPKACYNQILEEVGVPEKHRLYHLRWVRQFLSRNKGRDWMNLREPEITAFLEHLQETPSVEGWQVQQARDAIVLYLEGFCGIELGDIKLENSVKPETPGPAKPPKPELLPPKKGSTGRL